MNVDKDSSELEDDDLEQAAGGARNPFEDKNGNGVPDVLEPTPTFPTPTFSTDI